MVFLGAVALGAILAFGAIGQGSVSTLPTPLTSQDVTDPGSEPTGDEGTSGMAERSGPFAADASRIVPVAQPLTVVSEEGPIEPTVIASDVPNPFGAPDPRPLDAPFGANVQVDAAAGNQRRVSIVAGSGQDVFMAYETPTVPADIRIAKSTNGGTTWTILSIGTATYNRKNPDAVFFSPNTVLVFFEHGEGTPNEDTFRYFVTTNGGTSWGVHTLGMPPTFPFTYFTLPGASECKGTCMNAAAATSPVAVYVGYEGICGFAANCPGSPRQTAFFSDISPGTTSDWFIEIYSSGDAASEGFRPVFGGAGQYVHILIEFELVDDMAWDLYLFRIDQVAGSFTAIRICGTVCPSDDPIYGQLAVKDNLVSFGGPYRNPAFFSTTNHVMNIISSSEAGDPGGTWTFIQGGNGYFEAPAVEQKSLSMVALGDVFHAAYRSGTSVVYWFSVDGGLNYQGPFRASSNAGGTVVDIPHAVEVTYGSRIGVAFIDSRGGTDDPWYATLSGASMYIVKKNPATLGGTIKIDGSDTPVPTGFIWNVGDTHTVEAPSSEPGPPDTQYLWQSWSDGGANPHTLTVGAADTVLIANYLTQYFLTMTASVGGVTLSPGSSWQNAGLRVTIQCDVPAPGTWVRYSFTGWVGNGPGSYFGPSNPAFIDMNGPISELCEASREVRYHFETQPGNLDVTIDAGQVTTPQDRWFGDGSSHTVTANSPQGPPGPLRFVFDYWLEDGTDTPTKTFNPVTSPANWTAVFVTEYQMSMSSTPSGCQYTVDGFTFSGAQVFWFLRDSPHVVDMTSPQSVGPDTRYSFGSWSDGGAKSHRVDVTVPGMTLDLTCTVENRYVIDTSPSGAPLQFTVNGGPLVSGPQTYWWAVGGPTNTVDFPTPQVLGADARRVFWQWSDGTPQNPRTFTAGTTTPGVHTIQTYLEHRVSFATLPPDEGIVILVGTNSVVAPGDAWLRDGVPTTIVAADIAPDAGDPAGTRYVWQRWSDGGARSKTIVATGRATYTAEYVTEYYLDVVSQYAGVVSGEDWYPAGTTAFAGLDAGTVAGPPDTQFVFDQWTGDASGFGFSLSNGILMDSAKTATAQWVTQYRLKVVSAYGTPSGEGWKDAGSSATASLSSTLISGPAETRYRFERWTVGGVDFGSTATSNPILMDAPKTVTANWVTQYHITLPAPKSGIIASCTGGSDCWYDTGSTTATVSASAGAVESDPGRTRLGFIQWTGGATGTQFSQSNPITMNGPKVVDWDWQTQHKLTLVDDRGAIGQPDSTDGWYTVGTTATLSAPADPIPGTEEGVRYRFTSWSGAYTGTGPSASVLMDAPKTVTVNWQTQFRVRITTTPITTQATINNQPADPSGEWIDDGDQITIAVGSEVQSGGKTYKFVSWTGATSTTITVREPLDIVANFRESALFDSPATVGGLLLALVAAILIALFLVWRRKREPEEAAAPVAGAPLAPAGMMPPPPPAAPMGSAPGTMECPSCGLTIEAKTGPCPICGAEVVAPAVPAKDERVARLEEAYRSGRITKEQYQANMRKLRGNA